MGKCYEQEKIERLFEKRAKNDHNSTTLTHTLEKDIDTAFKGGGKFLLELLQNADDAFAKKISISLTNEQLIFQHDGTPFSKTDVKRICDNAQQQDFTKSQDQDKTGYKGIGFKSVFTISDYVHIISSGYSFRFDKYYFSAERTPKSAHPWPIIPIWTEQPDFSNEESIVYFIIKIKQNIDLREDINLLFNDSKIILFLRHVSDIEIKYDDSIIHIQKIFDHENASYSLFKNGELLSNWLVKEYEINIDPSISETLSLLSDIECPRRLKAAKKTRVQFAIRKRNDILLSEEAGNLYSYLPTEIKRSAFPALINSDFLLNAERTQLIDNVWNGYLIHKIPYLLFRWMSELALTNYRDQILQLMPKNTISNMPPILERSYKAGYLEGKQIPCIPTQRDPTDLIKIDDIHIDKLFFYRSFPEISTDINFAKYSLEYTEKLLCSVDRIFDENKIINHLPRYAETYKSIDFQIRIIHFINEYLSGYKEKIASTRFLLTESDQIDYPKNIYFYDLDKEFTSLSFVKREIDEHSLELKNFLKLIGLKKLTKELVINEHIIPNLKHLNEEKLLKNTNYLIENKNHLNDRNWEQLKNNLLLFTFNGKLLSKELYFTSEEEEDPIIYNKLNFIHIDKYIKTGETVNFFRKIGVKTPIPAEIIRGYIINNLPDFNKQALIKNTEYIFKHSDGLIRSDWQSLKQNLYFYTKNGRKVCSSTCFLSNDFSQSLHIETDLNLNGNHFINLSLYHFNNQEYSFRMLDINPVPMKNTVNFVLSRIEYLNEQELIFNTNFLYNHQSYLSDYVTYDRYHPHLSKTGFDICKDKLKLIATDSIISKDNLYIEDEYSYLIEHDDAFKGRFIDLDRYNKKDNRTFIQFLIKIGVKKILPKEIITDFIFNRLNIKESIISDTLFIFKNLNSLNHDEKNKLKKLMLVLTETNDIIPAQLVYLANVYSPEIPLEHDIHSKKYFLSKNYTEGLDQDNLRKLSQFFKEFGVMENFQIRNHELRCLQTDQLDGESGTFLLINRLINEKNIVNINFISLINNPKYTQKLYALIKTHLSRVERITGNDYILYYLTHNPIALADDQNHYLFKDLYSPSLKKIIVGLFPSLHEEIKLNDGQLKLLGVKYTISHDDLKALLDQAYPSKDIKRIRFLLDYIVEHSISLSWNGYLPAEDDSWQEKNNLKFLNVPEITIHNQSHWIKRNLYKDMTKLCSLLKITILSKNDLTIDESTVMLDEETKNNLTEERKIDVLSYFESRHSPHSREIIKEQIKNTLNQLILYRSNHSLLLKLKTDNMLLQKVDFYREGFNFYYVKSIKDGRVIRDFFDGLSQLLKLSFNNCERILTWLFTLDEEDLVQKLKETNFFQESDDMSKDLLNQEQDAEEQSSSSSSHTPIISNPVVTSQSCKPSSHQLSGLISEFPKLSLAHFGFFDMNDELNKQTGRLGEEIAYQKLKEHYQSKYPEGELFEHKDGFIFSFQQKKIDIQWMNKSVERYLPYDFLIKKNNRIIYADAKATHRNETSWAFFSRGEFNLMNEQKENYHVLRVYNTNSSNPTLKRIKNPASRLGDFIEIEDEKLKLTM